MKRFYRVLMILAVMVVAVVALAITANAAEMKTGIGIVEANGGLRLRVQRFEQAFKQRRVFVVGQFPGAASLRVVGFKQRLHKAYQLARPAHDGAVLRHGLLQRQVA